MREFLVQFRGFGVWGVLGFRVWGLGFRVWGLGFRVLRGKRSQEAGFRVVLTCEGLSFSKAFRIL